MSDRIVEQVSEMLTISRRHVNEMCAVACQAAPFECCGLLGGSNARARTLYPLRNVARQPLVGYEAATEDLFAAQRQMRARAEQLLAIYHSHPRAIDPVPSATDVRMAFYPSAIYFIIGLGGTSPIINAFRVFEAEHQWERVNYAVADDNE
ncbi:MAG: M67 family metallopeptidase [Pyrinomonadaceae bacterium]